MQQVIVLLRPKEILPPPVLTNPSQKLLLGLEKFSRCVRVPDPKSELVLIDHHFTGIAAVFAHQGKFHGTYPLHDVYDVLFFILPTLNCYVTDGSKKVKGMIRGESDGLFVGRGGRLSHRQHPRSRLDLAGTGKVDPGSDGSGKFLDSGSGDGQG